jgi:hypothetical protein
MELTVLRYCQMVGFENSYELSDSTTAGLFLDYLRTFGNTFQGVFLIKNQSNQHLYTSTFRLHDMKPL